MNNSILSKDVIPIGCFNVVKNKEKTKLLYVYTIKRLPSNDHTIKNYKADVRKDLLGGIHI